MEKEEIKKAINHFENDEFVDAREVLTQGIASTRDAYIKDKLGLKNDINPKQNEE